MLNNWQEVNHKYFKKVAVEFDLYRKTETKYFDRNSVGWKRAWNKKREWCISKFLNRHQPVLFHQGFTTQKFNACFIWYLMSLNVFWLLKLVRMLRRKNEIDSNFSYIKKYFILFFSVNSNSSHHYTAHCIIFATTTTINM